MTTTQSTVFTDDVEGVDVYVSIGEGMKRIQQRKEERLRNEG